MRSVPITTNARWGQGAFLIVLLAFAGRASAAGPYDGAWKGLTISDDLCTGVAMSATVANNQMDIGFEGMHGRSHITGTVAPDGSVTGSWIAPTGEVKGAFRGSFTGGKFISGRYKDSCGNPQTFQLTKVN